jgi:primosomal protein N' (replication factor Y)
LDEAEERLVATVVFIKGPEKPLDYLVPDELAGKLEVGCRVRAPLGAGNRSLVGYCVALQTKRVDAARYKPLGGVVDSRSLIRPALLRLAEWMSHRYLCTWSQSLEAIVPAGVRGGAGTREQVFLSVPTAVASRLAALKLPPKQDHALRTLAASIEPMTPRELAEAAGTTSAPIAALRKKQLVEESRSRVRVSGGDQNTETRRPNLELNEDQRAAYDVICAALHAARHETILVHGVTGSGKTEIYIQAIEQVIGFGRQAIVLVPEISLTPQTRQRFRERFRRVAVLHSHQTDAERAWHWEQIAKGEVEVVVGARSAVFAPTPHLGLIVIDEEHESTFKQATAPRYHARDVALYRAECENVPLVLGSATPSMESWHAAQTGRHRLVELPRRVSNRAMPEVRIIDLSLEFRDRRFRGAISRPLYLAMQQELENDGQVILLLNRRGFSTHIQCPACGHVVRCPHCDIAMTFHRDGQFTICHYCDHRMAAPLECEECSFKGIRYSGLGTQRLEQEVRTRFPHYAVQRMDSDTMQQRGSHEGILEKFRDGEIRILLGTQMIAKGLDFPNVTLVGVVNADTGLHLPDFRASERAFQLVTQVAGRTGRGERGGHVLVQTYNAEHPAIQAAAKHDVARFANYELPLREALGYSPYGRMIRIVVRGPSHELTGEFAKRVREELAGVLPSDGTVRIRGPAPAPIAKLRGLHRFHLFLQSSDGEALRVAVEKVMSELKPPDDIQWIADVDPVEML